MALGQQKYLEVLRVQIQFFQQLHQQVEVGEDLLDHLETQLLDKEALVVLEAEDLHKQLVLVVQEIHRL